MNIQTNQNWNLQFCSLSWTCTNESPTSGLTMLVVDIPSGYIMLQVFYYDDDEYDDDDEDDDGDDDGEKVLYIAVICCSSLYNSFRQFSFPS